MRATKAVQKILANYEGETPGVKANLCRIMMDRDETCNQGYWRLSRTRLIHDSRERAPRIGGGRREVRHEQAGLQPFRP